LPNLKNLPRKILPWIFLAPLLFMITLFWLVPVGLTIFLSFTNVTYKNFVKFVHGVEGSFNFTLENFHKLLGGDPYIGEIAKITLIYVGSVLAINAFYSLILSISIVYLVKNEYLSTLMRVVWLLPRITPAVVYGFLWIWLISPDTGPLYQFFASLGVAPGSWLLERPYSQILMIVVNGYVGASFGMIIYTSAIKSIPEDLIRAAKVDGASDLQIIRSIILPLLKWPMLFVISWQTLSLIASYEQILILWGSYGATKAAGTTVFAIYAWFKAFEMGEYAYGATVSLVLVAIGVALILLYFKIFGFHKLMQPSKIEV